MSGSTNSAGEGSKADLKGALASKTQTHQHEMMLWNQRDLGSMLAVLAAN